MVAKHKLHANDYQLLKVLIKSQEDKQKVQNLRLAHDLYVNNWHGKLLAAKKELKAKGVIPFQLHQILTDQEFNQLSISEQFNYALSQKKLDLPVTMEQDTYYEHKPSENHYEPIKIKTRGSKVLSLMGLLSLIDLIYSYCKIGK